MGFFCLYCCINNATLVVIHIFYRKDFVLRFISNRPHTWRVYCLGFKEVSSQVWPLQVNGTHRVLACRAGRCFWDASETHCCTSERPERSRSAPTATVGTPPLWLVGENVSNTGWACLVQLTFLWCSCHGSSIAQEQRKQRGGCDAIGPFWTGNALAS